LGIQSKLLAMLLGVSILSIAATGFVSYRLASNALTDAATQKLVALGDARTKQIKSSFVGVNRSVVLNSLNATTTEAMASLTQDFQALQSQPPSAADRQAVAEYYDKVFLPQLRKNAQGDVTAAAFLPSTNAQWYLQAKYTAPHESFDDAVQVDDAGDGTQWSADHAKYHAFFREVVQQNNFEDAMLVDTEGNVVYTAYKGVDLGTNLLSGPYKDSGLEQAFREVLRSNTVNAVSLVDFEPYSASYDVPTAFGLSPVGVDGKLTGVLVIQMPVDAINNVMTGNKTWEQSGLGHSGEAYLVGPDHTMRSTSRLLLENPDAYKHAVVNAGTPAAVADEIVANENPILKQKVDSPSVALALAGQTGTVTETDYLGRRVITAYAPLVQGGVTWAVLAQMDEEEALKPVTDLFRVLSAITLGAVLLVTLLSTLMARAFTQPVKRLLTGVRQVAGGDLQARVVPHGRDEFAALAVAFNDMATSLSTKQELLDSQMNENDKIIRNLMPETVARRFREGEQNIVEEHQDVSVVYSTIEGLDDAHAATPAQSIVLLNELVRIVEKVAEKHGLEKVRTLRSGYVASCGMVVPRVDHVLRCADFAREVRRDVAVFRCPAWAGPPAAGGDRHRAGRQRPGRLLQPL